MYTLPDYKIVLNLLKTGAVSSGDFAHYIIENLVNNVKDSLLSSFSDVLPTALTVAGAILVVNLGWRLFRNFTKG